MDIDQYYGGDVTFLFGDLSTASDRTEIQERIIRRLLTNAEDYLWHSDYGAGMGSYLGATSAKINELRGRCLAQISLEEGVAASPPPTVTLTVVGGVLQTHITYTDAVTNIPVSFSFNIEE